MAQLPDLLVLRHGETEWNRVGRMQGTLDSPLTDTGRRQAARQGQILQDFNVDGWDWVSSPQGRAMATAQIASGRADVATDARLAEIDVGDWTGVTKEQILAQRPDATARGPLAWYDFAPGGEHISGLARRVEAFLADVSGPTVVVTHGITSRVIRCLATGQSPSNYANVSGGQGVVYHVSGGQTRLLE
ncbi:MAG: histidine phosphatase family protein [Pseudomonadota bacterium]